MMILKISAFIVFALIAIVFLIKNTNRWAKRFQEYMLTQTNKTFGSGEGWDEPWANLLSKAMVVFFGCMTILLVYVAIFST